MKIRLLRNIMATVLLTCCLGLSTQAVCAEQLKAPAPEIINLKEKYQVSGRKTAVIFDHKKHQEKLECQKCHLAGENNVSLLVKVDLVDTIANDFHRKICWPCHDSMKVAGGKTCSVCHKQ